MNLLKYLAGLILFLVMFPLPLAAQDNGPATPSLNTRVAYGFDREFPPFSFEPAGAPGGFDVDLVAAIFDGSGYTLQMLPLQWDQVLRELAAGGIQVTSGMMKTEQRALIYDFSEQAVFPVRVKLFTKPSNRVGNIRLLKGKSVAVQKESLYHRALEEFGGMNVKLYDTELAALKALINDQVEVYCGREQTTYYYLDKLNVVNIYAVGTPLYISETYLAVPKGRSDLLKLINTRMVELVNNGKYAELYRKWFVKDLDKPDMDRLKAAAAQAAINAYAPYSRRQMGAAVLTKTGKIYVGCNVENAVSSAGVTALQTAVAKAITDGESEIRAVVSVDPSGLAVAPTADERQLLSEFGRGIIAVVEASPGEYVTPTIFELLPFATPMQVGQ